MIEQSAMNYGEITFDGAAWQVSCEPQVRARMKRLFPQIKTAGADVLTISHNAENCRDLLWFIERYPMAVRPQDKLAAGAAAHREQETLIVELLSRRHPPSSFELALPPREYQALAASLMQVKGGLLVADDVGLGKTVTSICPMTQSEHLPVLVVTLTHLPAQWKAEIERFAPRLKVHILKSGKPYDLIPKRKRRQPHLFDESVPEENRLPDVIISNYHKLRGWANTLSGLVRYVVFDEVQELRHPESDKYAAAALIAKNAILRAGLSATPIYNYGEEFHSVIDVLLPDALGTREEFLREWCGQGTRIKDPKVFGEHLRREGIMIRRTRHDVGRELPGLTRIPHIIDSDKEALARIAGSAAELARLILASTESHRGEKMQATEEFNTLMRQATGIAKAPYAAEFVKMLAESEEKIVVYAWHREVYAILLQQLAILNPRLYTGTESPAQKAAAVQAFVEGDCRVLLISLRSGAGLDGLQKVCRTIVHAELDWSPGVMEQCDGRVYRDGQADPVMAYYLMAEDGADPIIADVLGMKRGQIGLVRDPNAAMVQMYENEGGNIKRLAETYLQKHTTHHQGETK